MNIKLILSIAFCFFIFLIIMIVIVRLIQKLKEIKKGYLHREMDEMDGLEFEHYCANLLKKSGFIDVLVTKASGDYGVDITAEKDGISYGFQCKCYTSPIGIKAIQEIYAGRDYYGLMVGIVMTNQYFTKPAVEVAQKLNIVLWDRGYLEEILDETLL
ncbi:MAG: restriction endonuclease [Lachnospiraceae bacterium]